MSNAPRNWIQLGVLGLAIAGLGMVAWRKANRLEELVRTRDGLAAELVLLEPRKPAAVADEREIEGESRERRRMRDAEVASSSREVVAREMERKLEEIKSTLADPSRRPKLPPLPEGRSGNLVFAELFDDPGYIDLFRKQAWLSLEARDGPFLERLNGTPEIKARFMATLLDHAVAGVEQQRYEAGSVAWNAQQKIKDEMWAWVKKDASLAEAYTRHMRSLESRRVVAGFATRLSYSPHPLSSEQQNHLVDLMMNVTDAKSRPTPGGRFTPAVIAQAEAALTPAQTEALRKFVGETASTPTRYSPGTGGR